MAMGSFGMKHTEQGVLKGGDGTKTMAGTIEIHLKVYNEVSLSYWGKTSSWWPQNKGELSR
jgi:hypothetical protein